MRKAILSILCLFLTVNLFPQIDQQQATVINVAVPVRVINGESFVDSVSIDDFELYENGILQKIDALYLVKDTNTAREAGRQFDPLLNRTFYFLFQLTDWDPNIGDAVEYFFNDVFLPGDSLVIMTPERTFRLSPQAFAARPKEATSQELVKILRKDIQLGNSRYKTTMRNLRRLVGEIKGASGVTSQMASPEQSLDTGYSDSSLSLELLLPRYTDAIREMDALRFVDQETFVSFAASLKKQLNQKNVYLFYQREFRPEINPSLLSEIQMNFQDKPAILGRLSELFDLYKKDLRLDGDKINQAFADSSLLFNFIFSDKIAARYVGIYMREQSEDIFQIFSEAAKATGGIVESSQNLAMSFKKATEISAQYYLLYYSPVNYVRDGSFKSIEVKVKNQNYLITNRKGYFAR